MESLPTSHKQTLIRFQNRTHVVATNNPSRVLEMIADCTGWPRSRLELVSWTPPFASVRVISHIVGGKGGFGTLLKGQARQAGAKATSDFGACRDLQGRRLRHVNQAIEGRIWQEWKQKVEAGTATEEEMAQALLKTDTGLAGWHLQLPAWADVSAKKEERKWKRAFYQWKREREARRIVKEEERRIQEQQVHAYVAAAEEASAQIQSTLQSALQAGIQEREKKRTKLEPDPPAALITLTGDAVLALENNRWHIQSKSNFCTVGAVLKSHPDNALLYYEIVVRTGGVVQVGWATSKFRPSSESGDGVGDCKQSWGYDGSRQIRLHAETTDSYGEQAWKANDIVGCLYNQSNGHISYSVNGIECGTAFEIQKGLSLFPAISTNPGEIVELRLHQNEMSYNKPSFTVVGEILATENTELEYLSDEQNDEQEVPSCDSPSLDESESNNRKNDVSTTETHDETSQKQENPELALEPPNLADYNSVEELESLGLDRLKLALMAIGVKCGGTLHERASRLLSLKGVDAKDIPKRLLAKKKN